MHPRCMNGPSSKLLTHVTLSATDPMPVEVPCPRLHPNQEGQPSPPSILPQQCDLDDKPTTLTHSDTAVSSILQPPGLVIIQGALPKLSPSIIIPAIPDPAHSSCTTHLSLFAFRPLSPSSWAVRASGMSSRRC